MAVNASNQIVGLVDCRVGGVMTGGVTTAGVTAAAFPTILTKPYNGGVTITGTAPTINKFYREGEGRPFFALADRSSGSTEITWTVADFDDETRAFYFGDGDKDFYEGEKAFAFLSETGKTIVFARLKYSATLTGNINKETPLQISVAATMLAPETGKSWDVIDTPSFAPAGA